MVIKKLKERFIGRGAEEGFRNADFQNDNKRNEDKEKTPEIRDTY
jgi:hypothetical protein